jgi:hypothetical protein
MLTPFGMAALGSLHPVFLTLAGFNLILLILCLQSLVTLTETLVLRSTRRFPNSLHSDLSNTALLAASK